MRANENSRHVLGTAQLGMRYGVANMSGQPDDSAAHRIVRAAIEGKVGAYDTAQRYGSSESVLGEQFAALEVAHEVRVVTKLKVSAAADISPAVMQSLARLRVHSLWGLMLHDESDMDRWSDDLVTEFRREIDSGRVKHLGVSVYTPHKAEAALTNDLISMIQVPTNVFDRRFTRTGFFDRAATAGKLVFVRSVYLQGLILMKAQAAASAGIQSAFAAINSLDRFCSTHDVDLREFVFGYVRKCAPEAFIVLGAETEEQVRHNCSLFAKLPVSADLCTAWDSFWPRDIQDLIDPRVWPSRH